MKIRYGIHPKEFAIGETEKYYSDMAAKGWQLVKRGVTFSKFEKTEPKQMRYRVEVASARFLEERTIPDEQIAVYEECGWEYVTGYNYIHVFRSEENSEAPEFYMEPEQQAVTLRTLSKDYVHGIITLLILLFIDISLISAFFTNPDSDLTVIRSVSKYIRYWVDETPLCLGIFSLFLWAMFDCVVGIISIGTLRHKLKKGIPLDHTPKSYKGYIRVISWCLLTGFFIGMGVSAVDTKKTYLPLQTEVPYLLLSEIGVNGERTNAPNGNQESSLRYTETILAEHWDTAEYILVGNKTVWLYQDVYRLKDMNLHTRFIEAMLGTSTFAADPNKFITVEIPGLDKVYTTKRLECIVVKGDLIAYIAFPFDTDERVEEILMILSDKWN